MNLSKTGEVVNAILVLSMAHGLFLIKYKSASLAEGPPSDNVVSLCCISMLISAHSHKMNNGKYIFWFTEKLLF